MGWLRSLDQARLPDGVPVSIMQSAPSAAGKLVNSKTMQTHATAFACIRVISTTMASVSLNLFQENKDGTKRQAKEHPNWKVVRKKPNKRMTPYQFRNCMYTNILTVGNAYAQIVRDELGQVEALWPLRPDWIRIYEMEDGGLIYEYQRPGEKAVYMQLGVDITHWMYHTQDGITGISPIEAARNTLGLGIAQQEMVAAQAGNHAVPAAVLKIEGVLDKQKRAKIRESWEEMHKGPRNAGKLAVLDTKADLQPVSMSNRDLQILELAKYNDVDVTKFYGVTPAKVNILDFAHFANVSALNVQFIEDTCRPFGTAIEQCLNRDTLHEKDQKNYTYEHNLDSIEKGDIEQRWKVWTLGRQWGVLSPNDIAKKENLPPISKEDGGDERLRPMNYVPLGTPPPAPKQVQPSEDTTPTTIQSAEKPDKNRLQKAQKRAIYDSFQRIIAKESNKIAYLEKKEPDQANRKKKLEEFYGEQLEQFAETLKAGITIAYEIVGEITPSAETRIASFANMAAGKFMDQSIELARTGKGRELQALIDTIVERIEEVL